MLSRNYSFFHKEEHSKQIPMQKYITVWQFGYTQPMYTVCDKIKGEVNGNPIDENANISNIGC